MWCITHYTAVREQDLDPQLPDCLALQQYSGQGTESTSWVTSWVTLGKSLDLSGLFTSVRRELNKVIFKFPSRSYFFECTLWSFIVSFGWQEKLPVRMIGYARDEEKQCLGCAGRRVPPKQWEDLGSLPLCFLIQMLHLHPKQDCPWLPPT